MLLGIIITKNSKWAQHKKLSFNGSSTQFCQKILLVPVFIWFRYKIVIKHSLEYVWIFMNHCVSEIIRKTCQRVFVVVMSCYVFVIRVCLIQIVNHHIQSFRRMNLNEYKHMFILKGEPSLRSPSMKDQSPLRRVNI